MKKNEKTKRTAIIAGLSLLCICMICGLFVYMDRMADTPRPALPSTSQEQGGADVDVPEITVPDISSEIKPVDPPATSGDPAVTVPPVESKPVTVLPEAQGDKGTAAERQQEKEAATPPSVPPDQLGDDVEYGVQPEHDPETTPPPVNPPQEPQGGDTRSDGAIYVPGFGWVENSGENTQSGTDNGLHNGNKVGEM